MARNRKNLQIKFFAISIAPKFISLRKDLDICKHEKKGGPQYVESANFFAKNQ